MVTTGSQEGLSPAWSKDQEVTYFPSSGSGRPRLHMLRKTPLGQEVRQCQAIVSLGNLPTRPCFGIHIGQKMCTQITDQGGLWVWKIKQVNWAKENKGPEEQAYVRDFHHLSGCSSFRGMPESVLLLWMCFTALLLPQRNRLLLSVLSHVLGFVSDNKLYTCFYSLWLLETFFVFNGGKN